MSSIELVDATLDNIAGGRLRRDFQDRLREIADRIFATPGEFVAKDGRVEAKIKIEVSLAMDPSDGDVVVVTGCDLTFPKRKKAGAGIHYLADEQTGERKWQVQNREYTQGTLFDKTKASVTPIEGGKKAAGDAGEGKGEK